MVTPTLCTVDEALALIRTAPRSAQFAMNVRLDAPVRGLPGAVFPGALKHYVSFSRPEAIRLLTGMRNPKLEALGARVPLHVRPMNGGPALCYWIGN
jgi:hypothetical protein